jgi:transcription factor MBP1
VASPSEGLPSLDTIGARECVRAPIGRGASTNIANEQGVTAEELIQQLNGTRRAGRHQGSSSPYGPESRFIAEMPEEPRTATHHVLEAAISIQNRIVPQMLEKLHLLAASFDEELEEKDASEREARRILNTTIKESNNVQAQFNDLSQDEKMQSRRPEEKNSTPASASKLFLSSSTNIISSYTQLRNRKPMVI